MFKINIVCPVCIDCIIFLILKHLFEMKNAFLLTALCGVLFTACNNDPEPEPETTVYDVTFTVVEPEDDSHVMIGTELHMEVDLEGTKAIGNIELLFINAAGDTVVNYQTSTTETFFNVHEHYDVVASDAGDGHVQISAWESNYADRKTEEIHVHVM